jgi:hypothetical protein
MDKKSGSATPLFCEDFCGGKIRGIAEHPSGQWREIPTRGKEALNRDLLSRFLFFQF